MKAKSNGSVPKNPSIARILKKAQCSSMSGKTQLDYQIGADAKHAIYIRVTGSSGGGYFSSEWVCLRTALARMEEYAKNFSLTSWSLMPLFNGKSVNTPAFLMAALVNEGLLSRSEENPRVQQLNDSIDFDDQIKRLIAEGTNLIETSDKVASKSSPRAVHKTAKSKAASK